MGAGEDSEVSRRVRQPDVQRAAEGEVLWRDLRTISTGNADGDREGCVGRARVDDDDLVRASVWRMTPVSSRPMCASSLKHRMTTATVGSRPIVSVRRPAGPIGPVVKSSPAADLNGPLNQVEPARLLRISLVTFDSAADQRRPTPLTYGYPSRAGTVGVADGGRGVVRDEVTQDELVHEKPIDLRSLLRVFRRRYRVILLFAVLIPAAALTFSLLAEKEYTAKSTLLFRDPQLDQKLFGSSFVQGSQDDARQAATNLSLVSLEVVASRTARALNRGMTAETVQSKINVNSEGQADIASIEATDPDPRFASRLANTFARQYIAFRRAADRAKITEARNLVQNQLDSLPPGPESAPNARSLGQRLQELEILTSLQTGNAEQVQIADVPTSPSSPRPLRNTVVGLLLGLLLGLGFAFLIERFDRRLRDAEELAEIFGRPILTRVPASRELEDPERPLPAAAGEAFRMLRANLRYFNVDSNVRSVLVTSPQPGDGKSTVAWNLASQAATAGTKTLLIEADLRRPSLARWTHVSPGPGLSGVLSHQAAFEDAVAHVPLSDDHVVDILLAGPLPPNPDELLESESMRDVIRSAEDEYELVVVDTPPTSVVRRDSARERGDGRNGRRSS